MKKNLLTAFMVGAIALGASAETSIVDYTYVDGNLAAFGKLKKETIDVAMCINDPDLAGMKVVGAKAYLNTEEGISEISLWMSEKLTLTNKENTPDIESVNVKPTTAIVSGYQLGMISAKFEKPYVLGTNPLYVGYSLTVDDVTTNGEKYPIVIATNENTNGFWLHMSKSVLKWTDYSQKGGGVAYIVVEIECDLPDNNLKIISAPETYAGDNEAFTTDITVANKGANAVNTIGYSYTVDGGSPITALYQPMPAIQPSLNAQPIVALPFEGIEGLGSHKVELTINEINGQPNSASVASVEFTVTVMPFVAKKRALVEEYTGLWCGWCPRGYLAMEKFIPERFGDNVIGACFHSGDGMAVTSTYPVPVDGLPAATIDRGELIDPFYGSGTAQFGIADDIDKVISGLALADINVSATIENGLINISTNVRFLDDFITHKYKIGYMLLANHLTDSSWGQKNFFAPYSADFRGTMLEELTTWPATVYGLEFNDVVIDISGYKGVTNSLPTIINVGENYNHTYVYDINKNKLAAMTQDLAVVAFVINTANNNVINATKVQVYNPDGKDTGVENINAAETEVVNVEYFDLTGRRVADPVNGLYIVNETLSDGTVRTSKVMR